MDVKIHVTADRGMVAINELGMKRLLQLMAGRHVRIVASTCSIHILNHADDVEFLNLSLLLRIQNVVNASRLCG
jgi:hypothetical protein